MEWTVYISNKSAKQIKNIRDESLLTTIRFLVNCLKINGPFPGKEWANYGKLKGLKKGCRHCHLMKGNPTYVCCWEVIDKSNKILEVYYVGTHEKAPY
jgi:mRNA-degrading endonuclease YafQ of YafQ-DinJ toxin-antitoxin module